MHRLTIMIIIFFQVMLLLYPCAALPKLPQEDCVVYTECPAAVTLIKTHPHDQNLTQLLRSASCGNTPQRDMILCSQVTLKAKILNPLPGSENCGTRKNEPLKKIANGRIAEIDDFPWLALLKYKHNVTGYVQTGCHGTLISNKHVLTAAHCLKAERRDLGHIYSVVFGEYDTTTDNDCVNAKYDGKCADPIQEILVESFRAHEKYVYHQIKNDIGLIRLSRAVTFTDFIQPICLPFDYLPLIQNLPLWISGWGKTKKAAKFSNLKLKAKVFPLPKSDCTDNLSVNLDIAQVCAGSSDGSDACRGDSGGPLMLQKHFNEAEKTFLIGIVSFGGGCGSEAGIYTNTSHYIEWIFKNV